MRHLLLYILLLPQWAVTGQSGIRITGKVFTSYQFSVNKVQKNQPVMTKTGKQAVSDVKVLLIRVNNVREQQQFFENNRHRFCNNDPALSRSYPSKLVYTDRNGSYEFSGLSRNARYILVFCDKKIQLTGVLTDARSAVTYSIREKEIFL